MISKGHWLKEMKKEGSARVKFREQEKSFASRRDVRTQIFSFTLASLAAWREDISPFFLQPPAFYPT